MNSKRRVLKVILGIILVVLSTHSFSQNITASTENVVKRIREQPSLLVNHRLPNKNIRLANKLSEIASDNELINLTNSEDEKVACLAFLVLKKRIHPSVDSIYAVYREAPLEKLREINRYNYKWKSHMVFLESDGNFIYDVFNEGKYLETLK